MIDLKQFTAAMATIEEEKGISRDIMIETIESAVATAYKKDYGEKGQIVRSKLDPATGGFEVYQEKIVVDESMLRPEVEEGEEEPEPEPESENEDAVRKVRFNPERHLMVEDAKKIKPDAKPEDVIKFPLEYKDDFGRIAVQTAKQVIMQKIREAERNAVYDEFSNKVDTIISGVVQRIENGYVFFDIGKTTGVMSQKDTIPGENYKTGTRMRLYLVDVDSGSRGTQVFVSRSHPKILSKLFELEVPEIGSGSLEIKALAREAGSRSKIAVFSNEEGVDPIGSCVGQRGTRVAAVIHELGGEKIDIIEWSEDIEEFITNALSPARVISVDMEDERAKVVVASDQLSLAIGRDGQNVRLAAKLTGWRIDVVSKETGKVEDSSNPENEEEDMEGVDLGDENVEEKQEDGVEDKKEKQEDKSEDSEEKKEDKEKDIEEGQEDEKDKEPEKKEKETKDKKIKGSKDKK